MRSGDPACVDENGLLTIGVAGPVAGRAHVGLLVTPVRPEDFDYFDGSSGLEMSGAEPSWTTLAYRARRAGKHMLHVQVFLASETGGGPEVASVRGLGLAGGAMLLEVSGGRASQVVVSPSIHVQENYGGDLRLSMERLVEGLDPNAARGGEQVVSHELVPAGPSLHLPVGSKSSIQEPTWELEWLRGGEHLATGQVHFRGKVKLGRGSKRNDVDLTWLPKGEPGSEFYVRSLAISRSAASLEVEPDGARLSGHGRAEGVRVGGRQLDSDCAAHLDIGRTARLSFGAVEAAQDLSAEVVAPVRDQGALLGVLQGLGLATGSGVEPSAGVSLPVVELRRLTNAIGRVSLVAPGLISFGGGPYDALRAELAELPPSSMMLVHRAGRVWILVRDGGDSVRSAYSSRTDESLVWRAVEGPEEVSIGPYRVRLRPRGESN